MSSEKDRYSPSLALTDEHAVSDKYADQTLRLIEAHGRDFSPLSPAEDRRFRYKVFGAVMGMCSAISILIFMDKATLGYAAISGLFEETHISKAQYNNLLTFFYVGYIAFLGPGHYLMQKLPLGKFVAVLVFLWGAILFLHCVAIRYAGLIVLRIALGAAESVVVPAMEMTLGMFFVREEFAFIQPLLWMNLAIAPICTAFLSYGLLHAHSAVLPWKLLMIVTGGLSVVLGVVLWFFYPDNPARARFLSLRERIHAIQRVQRSSRSSIEQKHFKRYQFVEALKDPVSWLFLLQAFTLMLCNNLTYGQQNLLTTAIGIDRLGSTLVAAAGGAFFTCVCVVGIVLLRLWPRDFAFHGLLYCLPGICGGIGMVTLPWHKKISLLACMLLAGNGYGVTYIIALGWTSSSASGYTKKITRNFMFMVGYSIANLISPQIWVPKDAPRYYGAWISQIVISWVGTPVILFVIRFILQHRNAQRTRWIAALDPAERRALETGHVKHGDVGTPVEHDVDLAMLDLSDFENMFFLYPI